MLMAVLLLNTPLQSGKVTCQKQGIRKVVSSPSHGINAREQFVQGQSDVLRRHEMNSPCHDADSDVQSVRFGKPEVLLADLI